MPRSKSSKHWLKEHHEDAFVKQARLSGYRSRAVFKLKEMDERDHLLRNVSVVVDLGAAPGGWTQYVRERLAPDARVIALDILAMDPIAGVEVIRGDFTEAGPLAELMDSLNGARADLVLSDMAPNISGIRAVDQPRSMYLAELARDFSESVLAPGGTLVTKVFQGEGFDEFIRDCRERFAKVSTRKPEASRARSREVYVLARDYRV
jgi:23S rRNA (uridine2552-2'-O)-methyltransferase